MNTTRFFLSDVDGTLLDSSGELSAFSRAGLEQLLTDGLPFTIASARGYFSLKKLFGEMPFSYPIIELNGAFITDYKTGEHLAINALERAACFDVFERVVGRGFRPFVISFDGQQDCIHYDKLINDGMRWYEERRRSAGDPRLRKTPEIEKSLEEQVVSLTVMTHDRVGLTALRDELRDAYGAELQLFCYENEYCPGNWWLTIHHREASKHIAMQHLVKKYAPKTQTIVAIGDNDNDIEMLKYADHAVAVDNAKAPVKAVAQQVIGHHASDAVVSFLQEESAKAGA